MGSGVIRRNGQRLVEASQRRVMASERGKREAPIAMSCTRFLIQAQGLVKQPHRFRGLALLKLENAKHMQCIEIPRLRPQRVAIHALGITELALLMEFNRLTQHVCPSPRALAND